MTVQDLLPFVDNLSFPNILTAFKIFGAIPVTTCTCEHSISTLEDLPEEHYDREPVTETCIAECTSGYKLKH